MEMTSDYYQTWAIYWGAVVVAVFLFWLLLRKFKRPTLTYSLLIMLLALLLTPAAPEAERGYWVPAYMVALMEGLNEGFEAAMPYLWPVIFMMVLLPCLLFIGRVIAAKLTSAGQASMPPLSSGAEVSKESSNNARSEASSALDTTTAPSIATPPQQS
ncbi:MAG: hypothetical protein ACJAYG_002537 [Oceanicoccus sp.]|jgi:hypothetical protein